MKFNVQVIPYPEVLDINRSAQFYQEIQYLLQTDVNIILLDFRNVTTITSHGLMALVEAFRTVKNADGKLFICSINEQVRILFELTGLDQIFESFANLDEFENSVLVK